MATGFPDRVYTEEEVKRAKALLEAGYRHRIKIEGNEDFKCKVERVLRLIEDAGFGDFFRTYIRSVKEIDGLSQLHEADAVMWANKYTVDNAVDAASFFVQKANHMREYLDGELYYGGEAEKRSAEKRKKFLETLSKNTKDENVKAECTRLLDMWKESRLVY